MLETGLPIWLSSWLEGVTVGFNLIFVILLIREHIACWFFGVVGSLLAVILFLSPDVRLYSEAILYFAYAILGVYGWIRWKQHAGKGKKPIVRWSLQRHVISITIGLILWAILGRFMMSKTDASLPWADAFSTSFSFVATWLEAHKVLSGWIYWIVLNIFSIWLYFMRGLNGMMGMMAIFIALSVLGLIRWSQQYRLQHGNQ